MKRTDGGDNIEDSQNPEPAAPLVEQVESELPGPRPHPIVITV